MGPRIGLTGSWVGHGWVELVQLATMDDKKQCPPLTIKDYYV